MMSSEQISIRGRGRGVRMPGGVRVLMPTPQPLSRGAGRRGRGARRSRGGRGNRAGLARPHATGGLEMFNIEELPRGTPLEKALHIKKRRLWNPLSDIEAGPSGVPDSQWPSPPLPLLDNEAGPSGVPEVQYLPIPAFGMLEHTVEVEEHEDGFSPSPAEYIECGASEASSSTASPSTGGHRPPPLPYARRPLRDYDIEEALNYGSELDSGGSGEEDDLVPCTMPRELREALDTPEDAEMEFNVPVAPLDVPVAPVPDPGVTMMPHDFFAFEWERFPSSAIPPNLRREPFSQRNVGPTTPCENAYHIFSTIWNNEIMGLIVTETNRYAQQVTADKFINNTMCASSRISFWKDTTIDEIYVYFGVILAMGVVVK